MYKISSLVIIFGAFLLILSIINIATTNQVNPSLVRAETISGISSIALITIGYLWTEINPKQPSKAKLNGKEGFELYNELSEDQRNELAWGSKQILTATAASTILIYWDNRVILRRGLISNNKFKPGFIIGLVENEGIVLSTRTDPIVILEAKLEGKNISSQNQLIQQLKPTIGEKFSD